jgi:hypothetical protein
MRKPFILFFLVLSIFCWFSDFTNLIFYGLNISSPYNRLYCYIISTVVLGLFFIIYQWRFSKKYPLPSFKSLFEGTGKSEWILMLLVSSPVIFLGLFRALYPDTNYDQFHYELYLQEYDLRDNSINFAPGSIRSYFFPLTERAAKLFRYALGYRMGTIFNTFLLVTVILSIYDFLKKVYAACLPEKTFPRIPVALFALFAVFAENTLFTTGSYKTDLFGVPIVLEMIHLYFFPLKNRSNSARHVLFFLLGSISIACKLTLLPYVGILVIFYLIKNRKEFTKGDYLVNILILISFPLIYVIYNVVETGSPIFPFYNDIFQSKMFELKRFRDERYGIRAFHEIFTFHFMTLVDVEKLNEWHLYSYRLLMGNITSIIVIIAYLVNRKVWLRNAFLRLTAKIAFLALLFDYACVITSGYFRYGAIVEILYGLLLAMLFLYLLKQVIAALLFLAMFLQSFITFKNIYQISYNLSWHDYHGLYSDRKAIKRNFKMLFHDYGKITDSRQALRKVQAFVNVSPSPEDGLAKLLKRDVPIYDFQRYARTQEMISKAENKVRALSNEQTVMSVCSLEPFNIEKFNSLNRMGFLVTNMYEIYPDFLKPDEPVFLLEIKYQDTTAYTIKTTEQYIRDENPPGLTNAFEYNTGNDLKVFVREAPFAYSWDFLPQEYDITINGIKYTTRNRFGTDKIITINDNKVKIEKPNSVPYLVLIQELEKKK